MFVTEAHSFKSQARLSITLAWVAGYTNIVTFLACGTVTSHVSGTSSNMGQDIALGKGPLALFALFLLTTFFIGAVISGLCTDLARRRAWESIFVLPIIVEAFLLALFASGLELFQADSHTAAFIWTMTGLASAAMGLQNATITRISNGTVRTTHVTGVLTDLGHEAVQFAWWLIDRRRNVPPASSHALVYSFSTHPAARRLALLASILGSFIIGAGLAALAYTHFPRTTMLPPVAFLLWLIYQDFSRPIADIEPSNLVSGDFHLPDALAVFHLQKHKDRRGRMHRMPNLLAWFDRLPPAKTIVILDLGDATELDANAALELHSVLGRFAAEKRHLIIAGINRALLQRMRQTVTEEMLPPDNLCPDLELAIARGLNLQGEINNESA